MNIWERYEWKKAGLIRYQIDLMDEWMMSDQSMLKKIIELWI